METTGPAGLARAVAWWPHLHLSGVDVVPADVFIPLRGRGSFVRKERSTPTKFASWGNSPVFLNLPRFQPNNIKIFDAECNIIYHDGLSIGRNLANKRVLDKGFHHVDVIPRNKLEIWISHLNSFLV